MTSLLPSSNLSTTLFALWSGNLDLLNRFVAQVRDERVVVMVRRPGADAAALVASCVALSDVITASPWASGLQIGLNVGGTERGCRPNALLAQLAAESCGVPNWLQLPERAEAIEAFAGAGARLLRSCHDLPGVGAALLAGVDACTLSPIWPTPSKPGNPGLGTGVLAAACRRWPQKIIALGGIDARRARQALGLGVAGVEVASAAWNEDVSELLTAIKQRDPAVVGTPRDAVDDSTLPPP